MAIEDVFVHHKGAGAFGDEPPVPPRAGDDARSGDALRLVEVHVVYREDAHRPSDVARKAPVRVYHLFERGRLVEIVVFDEIDEIVRVFARVVVLRAQRGAVALCCQTHERRCKRGERKKLLEAHDELRRRVVVEHGKPDFRVVAALKAIERFEQRKQSPHHELLLAAEVVGHARAAVYIGAEVRAHNHVEDRFFGGDIRVHRGGERHLVPRKVLRVGLDFVRRAHFEHAVPEVFALVGDFAFGVFHAPGVVPHVRHFFRNNAVRAVVELGAVGVLYFVVESECPDAAPPIGAQNARREEVVAPAGLAENAIIEMDVVVIESRGLLDVREDVFDLLHGIHLVAVEYPYQVRFLLKQFPERNIARLVLRKRFLHDIQ